MNPAEAYILDQKEPFRTLLLQLQQIIQSQIPEAELMFKYRIPFFYIAGKPFCYLNQSKDYVDLGFWHSAHLSVHLEKMETRGRKIMRSLRYFTPEDINYEVLIEVLEDAQNQLGKSFWK